MEGFPEQDPLPSLPATTPPLSVAFLLQEFAFLQPHIPPSDFPNSGHGRGAGGVSAGRASPEAQRQPCWDGRLGLPVSAHWIISCGMPLNPGFLVALPFPLHRDSRTSSSYIPDKGPVECTCLDLLWETKRVGWDSPGSSSSGMPRGQQAEGLGRQGAVSVGQMWGEEDQSLVTLQLRASVHPLGDPGSTG